MGEIPVSALLFAEISPFYFAFGGPLEGQELPIKLRHGIHLHLLELLSASESDPAEIEKKKLALWGA